MGKNFKNLLPRQIFPHCSEFLYHSQFSFSTYGLPFYIQSKLIKAFATLQQLHYKEKESLHDCSVWKNVSAINYRNECWQTLSWLQLLTGTRSRIADIQKHFRHTLTGSFSSESFPVTRTSDFQLWKASSPEQVIKIFWKLTLQQLSLIYKPSSHLPLFWPSLRNAVITHILSISVWDSSPQIFNLFVQLFYILQLLCQRVWFQQICFLLNRTMYTCEIRGRFSD